MHRLVTKTFVNLLPNKKVERKQKHLGEQEKVETNLIKYKNI